MRCARSVGMIERHGAIWRWLAGAMLVLALLEARAQTIDDVSVRAQGDDMVASVSFNATVRFLQQTPTAAAQLYRIRFELVAADEAIVNQTTEESTRVPAAAAVPELALTYVPTQGTRVKQLTLQLRASAAVRVRQGPSSRAIDIVFVGLAPKQASSAPSGAAPVPVPAPASDKRYAVTLQSIPVTETDKLIPVPNRFDRYEVFAINSVVSGVTTLDVNLGYFATQEEAEAVRRSALERFPQATVLDLATRREDMLKSASASAATISAEPLARSVAPAAVAPMTAAAPNVATSAVAAPAEAQASPEAMTAVETRADDLMARSREALSARRNEDAINHLNQLLLLPPNRVSQEAQELIGLAWERVPDTRRARVEYELYLKIFPEGEGAQRVAQRLASLDGGVATPLENGRPVAEAGAKVPEQSSKVTGNIAQYYYGGKARSQSLVNIAAASTNRR